MVCAILAVVLVGLDQLVKYLVRSHIPMGGSLPFLPHILELTYVQNTGAAFSILQEHTWLLALVSAAVVLLLCWLLLRGHITGPLGRLSTTLVLAGGVGNLIDRALLGYVTDMFHTLFMEFPVFNVADCCITIGTPLLFLYVFLYWGKEERKEGSGDGGSRLPPDRS